MPPYFTHKMIRIALKERESFVKAEKERKVRTSLQDHLLFAIICDSKKLEMK
jgi:hypothetical protein